MEQTDIRKIKLIECPRDAMQGWKNFIPTSTKVEYINSLLKVGFDTLDFTSFVSAKAIPQMADAKEVVTKIDIGSSKTKLLAIVANVRGAQDATAFDAINYLGFPFSISPTFQMRNTNRSIEDSFETVKQLQEICVNSGKELVVYISMAFGNPYGDEYNKDIVVEWINKLTPLGIKIISLADTVGVATAQQVSDLTFYVIKMLPEYEVGIHLHSTSLNRTKKLEAALSAGCYRIDGALKGIGGCPMANDNLVGNMDMEWIINYLENKKITTGIDKEALQKSLVLADSVFY
ncbi:hydroxymethylglutaryl-CoA lyase [Pinibacter soli]|uniref:Hydroxymethylglutaryl-CoA lyase n=1 Tax=Pinibacter soli TaxID=3044211 RepID=A0ABT6RH69_9BACT|nr:hydroxymethylglutaryl-CoA lyase [Pinibacter soli]MDI3321918.1 hydroxymethylglutaryl-CoA lyase [Pinibacter soli]